MDWEIIDQQLKETFNRAYVACHEPYERKIVVDAIVSNFPQHSRRIVERAVERACRIMTQTPRNRTLFLYHIQQALLGRISESVSLKLDIKI